MRVIGLKPLNQSDLFEVIFRGEIVQLDLALEKEFSDGFRIPLQTNEQTKQRADELNATCAEDLKILKKDNNSEFVRA